MSVIPCAHDISLKKQIERFSDQLKVEAHKIGDHGLTEQQFYESGILPAAVERIRGDASS